ncbi:hypothetical protein T265_01002 [Opisthorchis viverrini]|uniref:Reverse transcriptase domain-containing protein n=1 Tax=Opisthorchis viverrini TaxID=6198 RepID=A0A075A182_OPIVI|nr:hypothetical protein T265_01002 [Opisthorchis viverrini]KER33111.1 hypothetical protein T265_01002 [Opisthorchis viverrini]
MGFVNQIFTTRPTLEQRYPYQRSAILLFQDLRDAFDSSDQSLLLNRPFRCIAAMLPLGSTKARMLPGCSSLDRNSRDAEVGFKSLSP